MAFKPGHILICIVFNKTTQKPFYLSVQYNRTEQVVYKLNHKSEEQKHWAGNLKKGTKHKSFFLRKVQASGKQKEWRNQLNAIFDGGDAVLAVCYKRSGSGSMKIVCS